MLLVDGLDDRSAVRKSPARCPAHWRNVARMDGARQNRWMNDESRTAGNLARNLASLRHTRSLTQDALAKAAAVPRSTIANLESGDGNPSLAVLVKVAGALGAPIDELLAAPRAKVRQWPAVDIAKTAKGRGVSIRSLVPE